MEESGKVFSLERIRQWQKALLNSKEEKNTKDNFIFKKATPAFDVVIIDESSKASVPELVLPLTLGKKLVLIGDHSTATNQSSKKDLFAA